MLDRLWIESDGGCFVRELSVDGGPVIQQGMVSTKWYDVVFEQSRGMMLVDENLKFVRLGSGRTMTLVLGGDEEGSVPGNYIYSVRGALSSASPSLRMTKFVSPKGLPFKEEKT